ncbi:hypothetical protein AArc1_3488 [Natrarchaeobaculum sulfurireducens]|uniref:Uncharacterized protein n=1 Tax=Natrarchaeobaculum sulfurireducens TaxID=2044521 RepID=A0A346PJT5_9EURY|nr:hypothetical protein AArc1_3488 [Natrarchaeobaculum sulfurireducens]
MGDDGGEPDRRERCRDGLGTRLCDRWGGIELAGVDTLPGRRSRRSFGYTSSGIIYSGS